MSFLAITLPLSMALAGVLLFLVIRAAREGQFDDWEGPAFRHLHDDDACPEREAALDDPAVPGAGAELSRPDESG